MGSFHFTVPEFSNFVFAVKDAFVGIQSKFSASRGR